MLENFHSPLARLLLQFIVIILATRLVGSLFARFGQPRVIGEITAGILLGPSLFGWVWPAASGLIFPTESLGTLQLFSQIGVCIFMFVVGLELDLSHLKQKARVAWVISNTGIIVPFLLGLGVSVLLYPGFGSPVTPFTAFALFMGIAMSITAFPVLVRILKDRGMAKTPLGTMAIACAAVDDATAWAILALVIAITKASGLSSAVLSLGLVLVFVAAMLLVVRPRLSGWLGVDTSEGTQARGAIGAVLLFMTASALMTELMGIHALFGAFLLGVIMPKEQGFVQAIKEKLGSLTVVLLLPLYFAFTGLRTSIGLLSGADMWFYCGTIIAVAITGKFGGAALSARLSGMRWREAGTIGVLMNTRGLMELIILNIGLDIGVISSALFTMMVLMAMITTFMTTPLLELIYPARQRWHELAPARTARAA